jgi:hypothetical protein
LQRNPRLPDVKYEWVWEVKYLKKEDAGTLESKRTAAAAQLEKYRRSSLFSSRTDVKYAALIFIGKDQYEVCEY